MLRGHKHTSLLHWHITGYEVSNLLSSHTYGSPFNALYSEPSPKLNIELYGGLVRDRPERHTL